MSKWSYVKYCAIGLSNLIILSCIISEYQIDKNNRSIEISRCNKHDRHDKEMYNKSNDGIIIADKKDGDIYE
jgi:hypothetical protein